MDRPLKAYKTNLKDSKFRQDSNKLFLNKYIKDMPELNPFKLNENKISKSSKKIIPGKIYTYVYDPLYKDVLSYYDTRPVVLLHTVTKAGTGNNLVSGINLNFLPEKIKVAILDQFFKLFETEIKKDEDKIWNNKLAFILDAIKFLGNWLKSKAVFERYPNINFSFAFRNYIVDRITELKVVEYDDWEIVPFLNSKDIIGARLDEIYIQYANSLLKK